MFKKSLALILFAMTVSVPAGAATVEPAAGAPVLEPVFNEAYVIDLVDAGYRNGYMPDLRMIEVEGCRLERDAAYTLSLMLEEARQEGISLYAEECYRSLGSQASAYERRCPVTETEVVQVDPETGEETTITVKGDRACSGPPIARPGRSNHGWGRAVDFSNGQRVLSCRDAGFYWLQENGARFGWVHPGWAHCGQSTREPWHWEWGGLTQSLPFPLPVQSTGVAGTVRVR